MTPKLVCCPTWGFSQLAAAWKRGVLEHTSMPECLEIVEERTVEA